MGMPTEFALKQNYPNPFNPSTQIQYALPKESRVVISIYDLTGRKVRTLVNGTQSAGYRTVSWNATNEMGRPVSAGMYIYSIQAGDFIQNRKMVLMK
jgi:flagellar hook assembly protein FlgD